MTGARQLVYDTRELAFKLPAGFAKDGINYVRIVLDDMIYADMLRDVFKSVTGLDCTL